MRNSTRAAALRQASTPTDALPLGAPTPRTLTGRLLADLQAVVDAAEARRRPHPDKLDLDAITEGDLALDRLGLLIGQSSET